MNPIIAMLLCCLLVSLWTWLLFDDDRPRRTEAMKARLAWLWKWCFCSWAHNRHRCYPEVWGRGLDGPWHCWKCHPCGKWIDKLNKGEWP